MGHVFCGIDLGGTTINIGLVTSEGEIVIERKIPSHVEKGAEWVVNHIIAVIREFSTGLDKQYHIRGAGIGVAGLVNAQTGVLKEATNFPNWLNVPLAEKLARRLNLPVSMDNDANVAALGEYSFGAGRGFAHMMMVTLGTGVGGGLILDGMIYRGACGAAGEFGHMTIDKGGVLCACGRHGCVEAYVGAKGIIREALALRAEYPQSSLNNHDADSLTPKMIYENARTGDEAAIQTFQRVGEILGIALGNVANLLNIQLVVIGGGVASAGDLLIDSAKVKLRETALNFDDSEVIIAKAQLGERAGIVGAASLAMSTL